MKRLIILLSLISGFLYGQTTVTLPPLRGGSLSTFNNSAMITDYAFIETNGVAGFYKLMSGDVTTPASDTVVVKADNTRWKLLNNLSPTAVTWASVTGKPTVYSSPSALKMALETLTGSARLDTSAIKNLSGITTESDPNVGSHIKAITADDITAWNAKYGTGASVVSSLSALSGTNRLPWSALKDVPAETDPNVGSHIKAITPTNISDWTASYRTGAAVVSSLSALSGSSRLPASAIKDLPTVSDNSTIQKIETRVGGMLIGTRKSINLIAGSNVTVTGSDNSGSDRVDITLSATGGGGTGMAEPSSNGLAVRTSSGASAARSIVAPAAGITITNGDGVSGNPTLVLADDLAGLEGLSTTGYVKRTGTGTFSAGTAIDLSGSEVTGTIAAARMPALTGDIVTSSGGVATTYNNVVPSNKGGAGTVSGLMKANGSGTVSAATAGTDYVVPSGSITGSAAYLTTARTIFGASFDGSANITSAVGVAFGGSGQTTAQGAMNTFAGAVTSGSYLRGNGTNVVMATIQAGDLPSAIDAVKIGGGAVSNTEFSYVDGVTSAIQTQLNAKSPTSSPTFTGTPAAPTASAGTNTTQIATTAFVNTASNVRIPYKTMAEVRAFGANDVTAMPRIYLTDAGKEGEFRYVAESSATDNVGTVIVTTSGGYRYQRVFQGAVYASWFIDPADAAGATRDRNAINRAVQFAIAQTTIPTVIINQGVWRVDNNAIYCNVPLNKTLKIRGEGGAIIDFLATGASDTGQDAVFRTANGWTWPGKSTAKVYGSISGDTLNVTYVKSGTLKLGQLVFNNNIRSSTTITELLSGTGTTGTYRVSRSQTAAADTVFANASMLGWTNGDRAILYGGIEISNLEFYGGRSTTVNGASSGYSRPMLFRQCQNVNITNCVFRNIIGSGFAIGVSDGGYIANNRFESVYAREEINDATGDAITLYAYCKNFTITGNVAILDSAQSGRCGISIDDCSINCTATGNTIEGYERGIHAETSAYITISGNAITKSPVGIITAQNRGGVVVSNNIIDATDVLVPSTLGYTAHLFMYEDNGTTIQNNTVIGGLQTQNSRYIAKFWGINLVVKNNVFRNEKIIHSAINRVTSTSSNSIPANLNTPVSRTFTYTSNPNLVWKPKQRLRASNSTYVYVEGYITAVSATSVTIQLDNYNGSGTYSSWTIQYVDMGPAYGDGYNDDNEFTGNTFEYADLSLNSTKRNLVKGNVFKSSYCVGQSTTGFRVIGNEFLPANKETLSKGINVYGATKPFVAENKLRDPIDYVIQQDASTGGKFYSNIYTRTNASAAGLDYFFVNTGLSGTGAQKTPPNFRNCIVDEFGNENYYVGNVGTKTAN